MAVMLNTRRKLGRRLLLIAATFALIATGCATEVLVEPTAAVARIQTESGEPESPQAPAPEVVELEELLEDFNIEDLLQDFNGQPLDLEGLDLEEFEDLVQAFDFEELQRQLEALFDDLENQGLDLDELIEGFVGPQLDVEDLDTEELEQQLDELLEDLDTERLEQQLEDFDFEGLFGDEALEGLFGEEGGVFSELLEDLLKLEEGAN